MSKNDQETMASIENTNTSLIDQNEKPKSAIQKRRNQNDKIDLFLDKNQNYIFKNYKPFLKEHQEKIIIPDEVRSNLNQSQYTILEYTKIGSGIKFCNMSFPSNKKEGHQEFLYLDTCAYSNCIFTCDKSLVNTADAFLTHLTDVEAELNQDSQARDEFFSKFQNYVLLTSVLKLFHYKYYPKF